MAKNLGSLLFSTAKRMVRLQRKALKAANRPAVKTVKAVKAVKSAKVARKPAIKLNKPGPRLKQDARAVRKASGLAPTGAGRWKTFIHQPPLSMGRLLSRLPYSLYRPVDRPMAGLPLVVMLHGCQQTAYEMALGTRMNWLADGKGFVVVYPQQQKRIQAFGCWRWFKPEATQGYAEADTIADLVQTLVSRHKLDRRRIYVAGLSAGAGMAGLTALRHPELFAAVAMHSGAVLGDASNQSSGLQTMRRGATGDPKQLIERVLTPGPLFASMPAIILHGVRDHAVHPRNAYQLAQQFVYVNVARGDRGVAEKVSILAAGTAREYERHDFMLGKKPVVRLCMVKGVGHAWSGGDPDLKFNAKEGPKACLLIWQFFMQSSAHSLKLLDT